MSKRDVYYGADRWRDSKFDLVAARDWLAGVSSDDPNLLAMVRKVAGGEYVNINKKITEFVVELQRSKYGDNEIVMSAFFGELIEELIKRLDLEKVTLGGLRCLSINGRLIDLPHIKVAIDSMIIEKSNALILK
jgi:hypothetical protein